MAAPKKTDTEAAVAPSVETLAEKTARLKAEYAARLAAPQRTPGDIGNALPGYHYVTIPSGASESAIRHRSKVTGLGYELATDGEYPIGMAGMDVYRIPQEIYDEFILPARAERLAQALAVSGLRTDRMKVAPV